MSNLDDALSQKIIVEKFDVIMLVLMATICVLYACAFLVRYRRMMEKVVKSDG